MTEMSAQPIPVLLLAVASARRRMAHAPMAMPVLREIRVCLEPVYPVQPLIAMMETRVLQTVVLLAWGV